MRREDVGARNAEMGLAFRDAVAQSDGPRDKTVDYRITIRISREELEQIKVDAQGMSRSAYVRRCIFGSRASKRILPEADRVLLAQVLAKLGETRIANNLNQIAYHANCGALVIDDLTIEEINEACFHVACMRTQLVKALGLKERKAS